MKQVFAEQKLSGGIMTMGRNNPNNNEMAKQLQTGKLEDVEFSTEEADSDDIEAQERAEAANARQEQ
jgi:hypothetical protein